MRQGCRTEGRSLARMERTPFFSLLPYNYREPKCLYVTWRVFLTCFTKEMKMKMCGKQGLLLRASGGLLMGCSILISSREYQEPRSMTPDHLSSIQSTNQLTVSECLELVYEELNSLNYLRAAQGSDGTGSCLEEISE